MTDHARSLNPQERRHQGVVAVFNGVQSTNLIRARHVPPVVALWVT
ncbi:MAG: hypothetical protein HC769_17000 [Cyanobacteria bacterium CRU_2_1]|nr:hypothetical protein [Cyanobacteria bacterium RU_5_0]NJR60376.1 hypothetical protein [Cyanobacteria bacterium CRU_2_1]